MTQEFRNERPTRRHIAVSPQERLQLENAKTRYEQKSGQTTDWGNFLTTAAALGLATLGVYALADVTKHYETSASIRCGYSDCRHDFVLALSRGYSMVVEISCPRCQKWLVVSLI